MMLSAAMQTLAVLIVCLVGASLVSGKQASKEEKELLRKLDTTMKKLVDQVGGLQKLDLHAVVPDMTFDETEGCKISGCGECGAKGKVRDVKVHIPKGTARTIEATHEYIGGDLDKVKQTFHVSFAELTITGKYEVAEGSKINGKAVHGTSEFTVVAKNLDVSGYAVINGLTGKYEEVKEFVHTLTAIDISINGGTTFDGKNDKNDLNKLLKANTAAFMQAHKQIINDACMKYFPGVIEKVMPPNIPAIIAAAKKLSIADLNTLLKAVESLGDRLSKEKFKNSDYEAMQNLVPVMDVEALKLIANSVLPYLHDVRATTKTLNGINNISDCFNAILPTN